MSISIPPERVPPIAKEVADARKTYAILWWFGSVLAALIVYGQSTTSRHDGSSSKIAGIAFWSAVLMWVGVRQWRIARRATEAARRAEEGGTFVLAGNHLIAIDERQVSQPSASFKLSNKLVTMLTALPTAQLRR